MNSPSSSPPVDSLDWTDEPLPRFSRAGVIYLLSIGGDALSVQSPAVEQISGGKQLWFQLSFVLLF